LPPTGACSDAFAEYEGCGELVDKGVTAGCDSCGNWTRIECVFRVVETLPRSRVSTVLQKSVVRVAFPCPCGCDIRSSCCRVGKCGVVPLSFGWPVFQRTMRCRLEWFLIFMIGSMRRFRRSGGWFARLITTRGRAWPKRLYPVRSPEWPSINSEPVARACSGSAR